MVIDPRTRIAPRTREADVSAFAKDLDGDLAVLGARRINLESMPASRA
jgi:hypothetical protein